MTTRAALHQLETLTYNVTEKEKDILTEVNGKLREIYSEFYRRMPNKEGIVLRPRDQRQVINMQRRVWKAKAVLRCSSLPSWRHRSGLHVHTETVLVSKLTVYVKLIRR